jgi:hypothetical protein
MEYYTAALQMVADLVDSFFEVDHFMERCLKFKCEIEAIVAPYKEVYIRTCRNRKQLKISSFFIKSSVSHSAMYSVLFSHPENFQPGLLSSH